MKKIVFLSNHFKLYLFKIDNIREPWIRIQIAPKFLIRIQIQCIWIHNTYKMIVCFQDSELKEDGRGVPAEVERLPVLLRHHDGEPLPHGGDDGLHHRGRGEDVLCSQVDIVH